MTDNSLELTITRTLDAPRALVWKAWSTKEHIEKWWCPKPWKARFTGFELAAGGAFDCDMSGPNGEGHTVSGSILDVVPQSRIVFTDLLVAGWRPAPNPFIGFTAIFTMEDEGARTRYVARCFHISAEDAKRHAEMGFYEGWETVATQLEEIAKSL